MLSAERWCLPGRQYHAGIEPPLQPDPIVGAVRLALSKLLQYNAEVEARGLGAVDEDEDICNRKSPM